MKPFDDILPEEQEEQHQELIALLGQAYQQSSSPIVHAQEQAIQRVEERLAMLKANNELLENPRQKVLNKEPTLLQEPEIFKERLRHRERVIHLFNTVAAVLVVGLLIGGSIMLFTNRSRLMAGKLVDMPTVGSTVVPITTVHVEANGVEMSMSITPGPYFVGELVEANLTLTNHTHQALMLGGVINTEGLCSSQVLFVQTNGKTQEDTVFTLPLKFVLSCGGASDYTITGGSTTVAPGQTIKGHIYQHLAHSGDVTLVGEATFYVPVKAPWIGQGWHRSPGPLAGHLPTFHIHVAPQTPINRVLSLHQVGSNLVVNAPSGIHLLDQSYFICKDSGTGFQPQETGYNTWEQVSKNVLYKPECPKTSVWVNGVQNTSQGTIALWKYALGAAGYEIVVGQQGHYSGPTN